MPAYPRRVGRDRRGEMHQNQSVVDHYGGHECAHGLYTTPRTAADLVAVADARWD